ncbi:MAG: c-type cytochrome biosis protein CcmI [Pseudomonadota bacterium]|jgi:cytochrome c-type biogenesis protein CcmH
MMLWIVLTAMIALAAAGLTIPLVRRYEARPMRGTAIEILKTQLKDVDAQLGAGQIGESEAEGLRAEIKRRILSEAPAAKPVSRPLPAGALPWVALGLVGIVALSAAALYATMGRPEFTSKAAPAGDRAATPSQHPDGDVDRMVAGLESRLQQSPNDRQGWQMLGWSYMRLDRPADAAKAYGRAASLDPGNGEYLSAQGEAMVQAEGRVSAEAVAVFRRVRAIDPADPRARYFLAIFRDQQGDRAGAMADLIALIKSAPPDAPWVAQVRGYAEKKAREQGIDLSRQLPPPAANAPGPTAAQIAAAGQMSDADRQSMIRSMVERLDGQLKANPRDVSGWVRLMRARMVLGEKDAAAAAYRDARKAFAGAAADQAALQQAAVSLGVPGA